MLKNLFTGIFSSENKLLFLVFILMFIAGILFTHFFVEPFFVGNYKQEISNLKQENALLSKDVSSCVKEKDELTANLNNCKQSSSST